jgi:hypothetical protein
MIVWHKHLEFGTCRVQTAACHGAPSPFSTSDIKNAKSDQVYRLLRLTCRDWLRINVCPDFLCGTKADGSANTSTSQQVEFTVRNGRPEVHPGFVN